MLAVFIVILILAVVIGVSLYKMRQADKKDKERVQSITSKPGPLKGTKMNYNGRRVHFHDLDNDFDDMDDDLVNSLEEAAIAAMHCAPMMDSPIPEPVSYTSPSSSRSTECESSSYDSSDSCGSCDCGGGDDE